MRILRLIAAAGMLALGLAPAAPAHPAPPFTTGFSDGGYEDPALATLYLQRTKAAGGQIVLLPVSWAGIAPRAPAAGSDPSDPANPAYHWGALDQAVRAAAAQRMQIALAVASNGGTPWADGPGRPRDLPKGTWDPDPGAFAGFAGAVARRYSGRYDPGAGALPRVRYYQAWSEPNLPDHLNPQWVLTGGAWVAESPRIYRSLLNAFYGAVKAVDGSNIVITGGTAPFGDPPGGARVPPALFVRQLLCLGSRLAPQPCPDPAHFDVLAHHPYAIFSPTQPAFGADDVSVPDFAKLTRPLAVAVRTGRALPRTSKKVWVTEFSYNTNPPNPAGVPVATDARWVAQTFYLLWRQGVSAIVWYLLVDQPCTPSCQATYQSGIYFQAGQPKPAFSEFRFPFLVTPAGHRRQLVWGIAPRSGRLRVERRTHGRWRTVLALRIRAHGVFTRRLALRGRPLLRARVRNERSVPWRAA